MGSVAEDALRGVARFRCGPGLACVLAYAAIAGPAPPRPAASGSVLKIEESPVSRVLYFEESGGLITPVAKPLPGSVRESPMPMLKRSTKALTPDSPVARADPPIARKIRLTQVPSAASKDIAVAYAPDGKREEGLRLDRRIDTDVLIARLASTATEKTTAERVRRIEDAAGSVVESYRNAQAAAQFGWLWLDGKEPANASLWF